jgi:hypothetical protein
MAGAEGVSQADVGEAGRDPLWQAREGSSLAPGGHRRPSGGARATSSEWPDPGAFWPLVDARTHEPLSVDPARRHARPGAGGRAGRGGPPRRHRLGQRAPARAALPFGHEPLGFTPVEGDVHLVEGGLLRPGPHRVVFARTRGIPAVAEGTALLARIVHPQWGKRCSSAPRPLRSNADSGPSGGQASPSRVPRTSLVSCEARPRLARRKGETPQPKREARGRSGHWACTQGNNWHGCVDASIGPPPAFLKVETACCSPGQRPLPSAPPQSARPAGRPSAPGFRGTPFASKPAPQAGTCSSDQPRR